MYEKLLACPFCGGQAGWEGIWVRCNNPKCGAYQIRMFSREWNQRIELREQVELEVANVNYISKDGRTLFVSAGLGGDTFGTFYRKIKGAQGKHRVKSRYLPMRKDRGLAQKDLDDYAKKNKLEIDREENE